MIAERADLVLGITADAGMCRAVSGAGGLGVLDLAAGDRAAREMLGRIAAGSYGPSMGVRVPVDCALAVEDVMDLLGARSPKKLYDAKEHTLELKFLSFYSILVLESKIVLMSSKSLKLISY